MPWLARIARDERATAVITHKGVIRATFALAAGWDMISKPPVRLYWDRAHLFMIDQQGLPHPVRFNIPLSSDESS